MENLDKLEKDEIKMLENYLKELIESQENQTLSKMALRSIIRGVLEPLLDEPEEGVQAKSGGRGCGDMLYIRLFPSGCGSMEKRSLGNDKSKTGTDILYSHKTARAFLHRLA